MLVHSQRRQTALTDAWRIQPIPGVNPVTSKPLYRKVACPCCHRQDFSRFVDGAQLDTYRFYAHLESFDQLNFEICQRCRVIFSTPRFVYTDSLLNDLFPDHVARRAQAFASRKPKLAAQTAHRVNQVAPLLHERRGRFLEIGCGFGSGRLRDSR